MKLNYTTPEAVEIGRAVESILGEKTILETDNPGVTVKMEALSVLDTDD